MTSTPSPANAGSAIAAGQAVQNGDKARHVRQRKSRPPLHTWPLGAASLLVLALNTLFWCLLLFPLALLKLVLPMPGACRRIDPILNGIARAWITCNGAWFGTIQRHAWDIDGIAGLKRSDWYLVNCNHQSWVDIFVLQRALNGRVPLLKFFLKQQLLYVPFIGLAWWALDFPFMKRHTRAQLRRKPDLRRDDQDTARRACEKFSLSPTSVMVFTEGTRFTETKRAAQASPYRHLLKPRAGGLAVTINTMGSRFRALLDSTIVYPQGAPSFWQFACGRTGPVIVRVRQVPIPPVFCTADYGTDAAFRRNFHRWLAGHWQEKDEEIDGLLARTTDR
ncbi:putative acyltransferase YihG [Cupriavidus laharis]|uniref:Acyltransferase YihG n=1 Tax=Cupriavidus laharis TaxID=151654 RepID=A0ABM8XXJ8_9BURK|nr:acyltransferase [Cupriavidus laharis]CAG9185105.1 putative acyltransferase YihG [Cupriavidus laharis]